MVKFHVPERKKFSLSWRLGVHHTQSEQCILEKNIARTFELIRSCNNDKL